MLSSSAGHMRAAGFDVTMDESRINVYTAGAVTLKSASPASFPNNRGAHLVLAGTGFTSGVGVRLERSGLPAVEGTNVAMSGSRRIECDVDLAGAAPGAWDVVVENPDHATARLTSAGRVFAATFYFAEGSTRPGFDPYLCIQNPTSAEAEVTITYMKGDGATEQQAIKVPKSSRQTVVVKDRLGTGDDAAHDFSCKVESTNGQAIIVERPIYFNYHGAWTGGHDVVGYSS